MAHSPSNPIRLGYQYIASHPGAIVWQTASVSREEALARFRDFPWEKQFEDRARREDQDTTSSDPAVLLARTNDEVLKLIATSPDTFWVHYTRGAAEWNKHVSKASDSAATLSAEECIRDFFDGTLAEKVPMRSQEELDKEPIPFTLTYNPIRRFAPLLLLWIPLLLVPLGNEGELLLLVLEGMALLYLIPLIYLNFQYYRHASSQEVSYDPVDLTLTVATSEKTMIIPVYDLTQVEWVLNTRARRVLDVYQYVRLSTEETTVLITHLTVKPERLLTLLPVNYTKVHQGFPNLRKHLESAQAKEKRLAQEDRKREELLQTYAEWDTEKLREVISRPDYYAEYARSAAAEVLQQRGEQV